MSTNLTRSIKILPLSSWDENGELKGWRFGIVANGMCVESAHIFTGEHGKENAVEQGTRFVQIIQGKS